MRLLQHFFTFSGKCSDKMCSLLPLSLQVQDIHVLSITYEHTLSLA